MIEQTSNTEAVDNGGEAQLDPVLEQLATHVPDLIVFRSHDAPLPQTIHSYGVVMFTDISGKLVAAQKVVAIDCITVLHCRLHGFVREVLQWIKVKK